MSNNTATARSLASIVWLAHRDEALSLMAKEAERAAKDSVTQTDAAHQASAFATSSRSWDALAALVAETRGHAL